MQTSIYRSRAAYGAAAVALFSATAAGLAGVSATNVEAKLESSWTRQPDNTWVRSGDNAGAVGPNGQVYQNNTTFEGTGVVQGPSVPFTGQVYTNVQTTHMLADDLQLDAASTIGTNITYFAFSVGNFNAASRSVRPHVGFFLNDGASGGPGTEVAAFIFNPVTVAGNTVSSFSFSPAAASQWQVPANRFLWAAMSFDRGGGSTASNAELDNFGQGLFNPPTIGSSQDLAWNSDFAEDGFNDFPSGGTFNLSGQAVVNFGWELRTSVPEPGSITSVAVTLAGLVRRRAR